MSMGRIVPLVSRASSQWVLAQVPWDSTFDNMIRSLSSQHWQLLILTTGKVHLYTILWNRGGAWIIGFSKGRVWLAGPSTLSLTA